MTQSGRRSRCQNSPLIIRSDKFVGVNVAREFDPNNLSAGDVLRAIAPLVVVIAIIVFVGRYAPDYGGLAIVAIIGFVFFWVFTLPKKDVSAIAEAQRRLDTKIQNLPIVGPIAGPLWRILTWLGSILSALILIWLVYWAIKKLL